VKHVLIITYYFPPAPLAYSQRIGKLCKYLARETDWLPQVICGELPWDILPGRDDVLLAEIPSSVSIERVGSFISSPLAKKLRSWHLYKPIGLFRKLLVRPDAFGDWINRAVDLAQQKFPQGEGIDAILASGPPNSAYVAAGKLSEAWGRPLIIDMRDPWDHAWGKYRCISALFSLQTGGLEKKIYHLSSAIITNTRGNMVDLKRRYPLYAEKVTMIPNGFDPEDMDPDLGPDLRCRGESQDDIHMLYLGGIRGKGFEEPFFRVLSDYLAEHPEEQNQLQVHFVGGKSDQVLALAQPFGIEKICQAYGVIPTNAVGRPLAQADIYVLILPPNIQEGWIPAKLYYYLAGGKHVFAIVPDGSAKNMLLELGELATIADYNEMASAKVFLANVIKKIRQSQKIQSGESIPPYAQVYDRRHLARQVASVLDEAVGSPKTAQIT